MNDVVVTSIGGQDFDIRVYHLGDRYFASRGNEFSRANHEAGQVEG